MRFIISGKNIEVTEGIRSAIEHKLSKLDKYFSEDAEIFVTLSVASNRQKIDVTIPMKGLKASLNVGVAFGILMQKWVESLQK